MRRKKNICKWRTCKSEFETECYLGWMSGGWFCGRNFLAPRLGGEAENRKLFQWASLADGVSGASKPITRPPRRLPDSNPAGTCRISAHYFAYGIPLYLSRIWHVIRSARGTWQLRSPIQLSRQFPIICIPAVFIIFFNICYSLGRHFLTVKSPLLFFTNMKISWLFFDASRLLSDQSYRVTNLLI